MSIRCPLWEAEGRQGVVASNKRRGCEPNLLTLAVCLRGAEDSRNTCMKRENMKEKEKGSEDRDYREYIWR